MGVEQNVDYPAHQAQFKIAAASREARKQHRKGVIMKFDFGEVLTRAGQITWRHKNLWLAGIVISLIGFLAAPISLILNPSFSSFADPAEVNRQLPSILLVNGLIILLTILSIPFYVIGMSVPSLGTLQLEQGSEKVNFGELIRGVLPYFWRILGIVLLVWVSVFVVMMIFMACVVLLGVFTLGIGSLCAFPVFILFLPLVILVYAVMEQGVSAVLVDNLGISSALQRAWELVKKNLGVMALMSVILYLGSIVVGMIISIPMMIPMFGFMFNLRSEPDVQSFERLSRNMVLWMLAFSPLYAVFQGVLLTFMQSAWTLTYMRLTRSIQPSQLLPGTVGTPS